MKEYFRVSVADYVTNKGHYVVRPASINNPKDNAVMFIDRCYIEKSEVFLECSDCLVFWPEDVDVPDTIKERHAVVPTMSPRNSYCSFFRENHISYYPPQEKFEVVSGAYIAEGARLGRGCTILPGAYIGGDVELGENCYVGSGTRLVGRIQVGNNVVIRENTVIGADGLSTDRDERGRALTMPQFGGVRIGDDVQVGALTVIARGAIDDTVICRGAKIDNCSFISHNVVIGEDTFVVGETIMFGSSSTGRQAFISGNSTIRDGRRVGERAIVGMGSVVVRDVEDGTVVKGNPAR